MHGYRLACVASIPMECSENKETTVALVSHHKNHYALVFALRERCDADEGCPGGVRWTREMLTARRGQRPSAWISWEEARATMLGWSGYGILAVTVERGGER